MRPLGTPSGRSNMREHFSLTLSFAPVEDDWVQVTIEEFPEVVTVAPTQDEARLLALDAFREYLASFPPGEKALPQVGLTTHGN